MATWIAHMRIAEHFMKQQAHLSNEQFLVGNIGPDCGVPNEDWSHFTPDKNVTHWLSSEGIIDAEDFRGKYLLHPEDERYPFYLGYYYHLLTDMAWSALFAAKKQEKLYAEGLAKDERFVWTIKKDWYGQDHVYLREHPHFIFFTMFTKISAFPNPYFDFYPANAFIRQIRYITDFYLSAKEDANRYFPYLSKGEMDGFVKDTIAKIEGQALPL